MEMIKIPEIYRDIPNTAKNRFLLKEFVDILLAEDSLGFDSGNLHCLFELVISKGVDPEYLKEIIDYIVDVR